MGEGEGEKERQRDRDKKETETEMEEGIGEGREGAHTPGRKRKTGRSDCMAQWVEALATKSDKLS